MGKTPWRNVIVGTYNQTFAGDFGEDVRAIMIGQRYQDVFKTRLRTGSKSKEQLVTEEGGRSVHRPRRFRHGEKRRPVHHR